MDVQIITLITYKLPDGNIFTITHNEMFDGKLPINLYEKFKENPSIIKIELIKV